MSAYIVLRRKCLWVKLFWIREVSGIPVYGIRWYKYVGSCWNNMTVSKINFLDCLSENNFTRIPFAGEITKDNFRVSSRSLTPPSISVTRYLLSTVDKMFFVTIVANT
jgi:hypothetical protein